MSDHFRKYVPPACSHSMQPFRPKQLWQQLTANQRRQLCQAAESIDCPPPASGDSEGGAL